MAGYSGTPLIKKLGIKPGMRIKLIGQPKEYFELLGNEFCKELCKRNEAPDLVHVFVKNLDDFNIQMQRIKVNMKPTTIIWVSWYKKSSGFATDINEDGIRNYALHNDLVDVKVCAINDVWSGLKLVIPLSKRK